MPKKMLSAAVAIAKELTQDVFVLRNSIHVSLVLSGNLDVPHTFEWKRGCCRTIASLFAGAV